MTNRNKVNNENLTSKLRQLEKENSNLTTALEDIRHTSKEMKKKIKDHNDHLEKLSHATKLE